MRDSETEYIVVELLIPFGPDTGRTEDQAHIDEKNLRQWARERAITVSSAERFRP